MKTASAMLLCSVLIGAVGVGFTQEQNRGSGDARTVTLTGYIVDVMCGNAIAKKSNPMTKAPRHTRACALAEACSAEGYGIFSDGNWVLFDKKSSALANDALKKDNRQKELYFRVKGSFDGDRFVVTSIEALPAPEATNRSGTESSR